MSEDKVECLYCGHKDEPEASCRSAIGQYGAIILADLLCRKCGHAIVRGFIVDNSGNIPPKRD